MVLSHISLTILESVCFPTGTALYHGLSAVYFQGVSRRRSHCRGLQLDLLLVTMLLLNSIKLLIRSVIAEHELSFFSALL